jgi:hypothetical protein
MSEIFLTNPDVVRTSSIVGTFSKLNVNSVGIDENLACKRCPAEEAMCLQHSG